MSCVKCFLLTVWFLPFFISDKIDEFYVPVMHFNSGIVAGLLASFITQPADVMKTHMQLNPQKHIHIKDVITFIYQVNNKKNVLHNAKGLYFCLIKVLQRKKKYIYI